MSTTLPPIIRPAKKTETEVLANLVLQAGGGIIEYLLHNLIQNMLPEANLTRKLAMDDWPTTYRAADVAVSHQRVVGIAHYFPATHLKPHEPSFIPYERLEAVIAPLYRTCPREALYLQSLAVTPDYQGKGIGMLLLRHVIEIARQKLDSRIMLS